MHLPRPVRSRTPYLPFLVGRLGKGGTIASVLLVAASSLALAPSAASQLPAPPVPPLNPITPEKTVLGKILFWDEQLSSDNTVACGTCHRSEFGGGDPRSLPSPGLDGIFGTPDDPFGSPGVLRADAGNDYEPDPIRGFSAQVTTRNSPSFIGAQYFTELFWDGRASSEFTDPESGTVSLANRAALESQSVGPPLSDVEMAHQARSWDQIVDKLESVEPLKLASDLPPDVLSALATFPDYPSLFQSAFGDPTISAERIAMAIATYERVLIPDETPFDLFMMGDPTALTPNQQAGLLLFQNLNCASCHPAPLFTDDNFRNIGLRPVAEDRGRQDVTGNPGDRGRFKTPSLRNVGLRQRFMHNGEFVSLNQVVGFYNGGGRFPDNRDPRIVRLGLNPMQRNQLADFLRNGLTDPRVASASPPFDRPTLHSELTPANPELFGTGTSGAGGLIPEMIAHDPPNLGNREFRLGVGQGLGGAPALLMVSNRAAAPGSTNETGTPLNIDLDALKTVRPLLLEGTGAGTGFGTFRGRIPNRARLDGRSFFVQWLVEDPAGTGGFAATVGAELRVF